MLKQELLDKLKSIHGIADEGVSALENGDTDSAASCLLRIKRYTEMFSEENGEEQ